MAASSGKLSELRTFIRAKPYLTMKELRFTYLTAQDVPELHQTFLEAFADYVVPIQLDAEQFKAKLKREAVDPAFCVAAYHGSKIVGFILTGLGEWQGAPTAYNAGTGVLPAYRGQQLTQKLYTFMLSKLRESGVENCLLEVIKGNEAAIKSYQHVGLQTTRTLDCFRTKKEELLLNVEAPVGIVITNVSKPDWELYQSFWDITPTWQNSVAAVKRSTGENMVLEAKDQTENVCGYTVVYPKSGAIAQLAVARNHRNEGIGTALLREAVKFTQAPSLMCINIDTAGTGVISYLNQRYFKPILQQYEMQMLIK